jgi:hypothetical protein
MPEPGSVVRFLCVADEHQPRLISLDFGLTVHLREWGFCPAGERNGHDWRRVEGVALETLLARRPDEAFVPAD